MTTYPEQSLDLLRDAMSNMPYILCGKSIPPKGTPRRPIHVYSDGLDEPDLAFMLVINAIPLIPTEGIPLDDVISSTNAPAKVTSEEPIQPETEVAVNPQDAEPADEPINEPVDLAETNHPEQGCLPWKIVGASLAKRSAAWRGKLKLKRVYARR
ncbi:hypothetical protein M426DRAFT_11894 [Hypoxylon sp. CI-4A]|nr:hypothetical protein M426DRAFT_11894 [Hypoxylon sp. CI-4A]